MYTAAAAHTVSGPTSTRPTALVLAGTGAELPVNADLREWLASDFGRAVAALHGQDRLFHTSDDRLQDRSREQMRSVGRPVTERDFLSCHSFDVTDRLAAIDIPTLALCGAHDRLTPRAYHEQLARDLPRGEFAVVPDAAHLAMLERPAQFNGLVAGFLDDRVGNYSQ